MRPKKGENMGEIKSVKVDNWGVFFLQKLQNFFNKTDYCDLTLQFNDNSQLKVHRLVLNACTDYFNVLEQTCEMIEDVLIMPNELQADLVVPIVNFMYTGTLEFELKIYGKLLKTARDMNMTVLLKLLEAHRKTMETKPKNQKTSPKGSGFTPMKQPIQSNKSASQKNTNRTVIGNNKSATMLSTKSQNKTIQLKGPTRYDYEGTDTMNTFDTTFDNISYESKPLKVEYDEHYSHSETSPFEQLRQTGYNNNKRPATSVLEVPPVKKPNIQDVKEYAEQQRMRKQIAEDYGEDPDFDSILDDEFHNNDDDEEYGTFQESVKPTTSKQSTMQKQKGNSKKSNDTQKATIVVKENSSSNVDHAKIISEVLRKYPHLIKNNKNIKLKIMPTSSGSTTQKVVIKKEADDQGSKTAGIKSEPLSPRKISQGISNVVIKSEDSSVNKSLIDSMQKRSILSTTSTPNQPRRIDSKTMRQLIALGAENTTGPWLCLQCGSNGRPISIPSYRGFRRHLVNLHKEKIDPRLCEYCGWRSINQKELAFHMYTQHDIKSSISFPKCEHCETVVFDLQALDQHIDDVHPEVKEDNQQCIYCNKTFSTELMLYNHMRNQHKERARDDGVIDFSEEDEAYEEYEQNIQNIGEHKSGSKIQILSDIDLPKCISLTQINKAVTNTDYDEDNLVDILGGNAQIVQPGDLLSSIPSVVSIEPKFINAEGNVMELTAAQRAEIMSQLEQSGDGVVMVLDESFSDRTGQKAENLKDEIEQGIQIETDHEAESNEINSSNDLEDNGDNVDQPITEETIHDSNSVHQDLAEALEEELNAWKPIKSNQNKGENSENKEDDQDETAESLDEQLEKLTQMAQPMSETNKLAKPTKDELDERLKMLTNDWTDDEEEGEEEQEDEEEEIQSTAQRERKININISENEKSGKKNKSERLTESSEKHCNETDEDDIEGILESGLEKQPINISNSEDKKENKENVNKESENEDKKESEIEEKTESSELSNKDKENIEKHEDNREKSPVLEHSADSNEKHDTKKESISSVEKDGEVQNNDDNPVIVDKDPKEINEEVENKEEKDSSNENLNKSKESGELKQNEEKKIDDKDSNVSLENEEKNEKLKMDNKTKKEGAEEKSRQLSTENKDDIKKEKLSPDTKKEIKNLINEWDDENDDDNDDL